MTTKEATTSVSEQRPVLRPLVDIYEDEEKLVLVAELPGVGEKDVDVHVENDVLSIHGRATPHVTGNLTARYKEYAFGDYERTFRIGEHIDREHIAARMKHGVLRVELPKTKETQPRRIQVQLEE